MALCVGLHGHSALRMRSVVELAGPLVIWGWRFNVRLPHSKPPQSFFSGAEYCGNRALCKLLVWSIFFPRSAWEKFTIQQRVIYGLVQCVCTQVSRFLWCGATCTSQSFTTMITGCGHKNVANILIVLLLRSSLCTTCYSYAAVNVLNILKDTERHSSLHDRQTMFLNCPSCAAAVGWSFILPSFLKQWAVRG